MGMLLNFFRVVMRKFAGAALIVVLGLTAAGLYLYLKDNVDFETWRQDVVRAVTGERAKVHAALADVNQRMTRISAEMVAEEERGKQADKVIAQLQALESTWDRFVGNPAQQKANQEQLARMTELRVQVRTKVEQLQKEFTRTTWERDGLEIALGKVETQLRAVEAQQSRLVHYFERVWNYRLGRDPIRLEAKWWLLVALVLYFIGPTFWKVGLYFFVAPFVVRRRPVRLQIGASTMPEVGASKVSAELALEPGERLRVKEQFLQASDEGLQKTTRYLLDWRVPLTCLATGLAGLIEIKNAAADTNAARRLTLSNQSDPHCELAVVTLVEGSSLILRPSFLAGVITAGDSRLRIRRRWQLFRWQSWVTLQFRFFEFIGPCRLIVAGKRGVRVEDLSTRDTEDVPARRTNQDATMGFTPNLDYRPARAETFLSYYRGMNPLFDDLFAGRGMFLCQQVAARGDKDEARNFWGGVWGGAMKVFGM
jgi:hypothetical protein